MADVKILNGYDIKDAKALRNKNNTPAENAFIDSRAGTTGYPTNSATSSVVIGYRAQIRYNGNRLGEVVIGNEAYVTQSYSTVVGYQAHASMSNAVSIGYNAQSGGDSAISIGYNSQANSNYGVTVGASATNSSMFSVLIGYSAQNSGGQWNTVVGSGATTRGSNYNTVLGAASDTGTSSSYNVICGSNSTIPNYVSYASSLGASANARSSYSVQLGAGNNYNYGSLQFRDWPLVNSNGKIYEERLPDGIKTATPRFPNLYNINEENVSEQAILYTGPENDSYKNDQFYRGRVRYGYPRFNCSWADSEWLDSYNDVMIDQQKFFTKLAEVTKQRIDDDDVENGLIGGGNSEQSVYLYYDADNDYYFIRFDSDSFEAAFNHIPDDITGLSFDDFADYGIYFRNFHKPSDLEGEYEFCDIYYYAPAYIDSYDWNNSPSYVDYFKFLYAMNDGDWGARYVISNIDEWTFEVDGTDYICPIIPKTYEWNGDEYDGVEIRWEWTGDDWKQFINGEDIDHSWSTEEMYDTFGIKIDEGEEENIEYINLYVRGGDQRYWEQFDPVNIENFATTEQLEDLSGEVDALKNWSVQVVTGGKDLNNYTTEGVYQFVGSPITNKPSTVDTRFIMLVQVYSGIVKQIIFATRVSSSVGTAGLTSYAPTIFHRVRNSGTWAQWQTVLSGDWSNYITGFDRTKRQKLIHQDNSISDANSAVPMWVADTGGGSYSAGDGIDITNNKISVSDLDCGTM